MNAAEHLTYQGIDFGTGPDADKLRSTYMREGGETPERARIRKELADKKHVVDDAPPTQPAADPVTDFLHKVGGSPTLTAIVPDSGTTNTKSFKVVDDAVTNWVSERNKNGAGIYWQVNPSRELKDKKAKKEHVAAVRFLHVDCDCRVGEPQDVGIKRILEKAESYKLRPTIINVSGGGVQLFWRLEPPVKITDKASIDEIESYNKQLIRDFDGDVGTHNIDRIMRLVGTTNWPNAGKKEKGRIAAPAYNAEFNELSYSLDSFAKVAPDEPKENTLKAAPKVETDLPTVTLDMLRAAGIPQDIIDIITTAPLEVTGAAGDTLKGGGIHFKVISALRRATLGTAEILAVYRDFKIGDGPRQHPGGYDRYMAKTIAAVNAKIGTVVSEHDHRARARTIAESKRPNLKRWRDDFVDWVDGHYVIVDDATIHADVGAFLEPCMKLVTVSKGKMLVPFQPSDKSINETIHALEDVYHLPPAIAQPCWLDGRAGPDPVDLISFPNGNLNLVTDILEPGDPMLFSPNACAFPYDPKAGDPVQWLVFLDEVFDKEQDQIDALQEAMGYCMTIDTSQEKGFLTIGSKRGGKDTIMRVLRGLLSADATCGPTPDSMATNFGMSAFIGKTLAVIGDMRIGGRVDKDLLTENILKLTGRSEFTIDRKNKSHWHGVLPCKLWMVSNEPPAFKDTEGALASRLIIFQTRTTFYGRENPHFFRDKLKPELPMIALWALEGLKRMRARTPHRLAEPQCSVDERENLARAASPVMAFVHECLILDLQATLNKDDLHAAFNKWAVKRGLYEKSSDWFYRDLRTVTGGKVVPSKSRGVPVIKGVRFATKADTQKGENQDEIPF